MRLYDVVTLNGPCVVVNGHMSFDRSGVALVVCVIAPRVCSRVEVFWVILALGRYQCFVVLGPELFQVATFSGRGRFSHLTFCESLL